MERFRNAMLVFQTLSGSPKLVPTNAAATLAPWGSRYCLPRLSLLNFPVVLPFWHHTHEVIRQFPVQAANVVMTAQSRSIDVWRRFEVALPNSQLSATLGISIAPLTTDTPRRVRGRGILVPWQFQQFEFRSWYRSLCVHPALCVVVGGITVHEFILQQGCNTRTDVKSLVRSL
eukprot:6487144-Amphidinium_carterae.1